MTDRTPTPWADDDDGDHSAFTHRDDDEPPPYDRTPTTAAGRAWLATPAGLIVTGMRAAILAIEAEARAPYLTLANEAKRTVDNWYGELEAGGVDIFDPLCAAIAAIEGSKE